MSSKSKGKQRTPAASDTPPTVAGLSMPTEDPAESPPPVPPTSIMSSKAKEKQRATAASNTPPTVAGPSTPPPAENPPPVPPKDTPPPPKAPAARDIPKPQTAAKKKKPRSKHAYENYCDSECSSDSEIYSDCDCHRCRSGRRAGHKKNSHKKKKKKGFMSRVVKGLFGIPSSCRSTTIYKDGATHTTHVSTCYTVNNYDWVDDWHRERSGGDSGSSGSGNRSRGPAADGGAPAWSSADPTDEQGASNYAPDRNAAGSSLNPALGYEDADTSSSANHPAAQRTNKAPAQQAVSNKPRRSPAVAFKSAATSSSAGHPAAQSASNGAPAQPQQAVGKKPSRYPATDDESSPAWSSAGYSAAKSTNSKAPVRKAVGSKRSAYPAADYEGSAAWSSARPSAAKSTSRGVPAQPAAGHQATYIRQPNGNGPFKQTSGSFKRGEFKYTKEDSYEGSQQWSQQRPVSQPSYTQQPNILGPLKQTSGSRGSFGYTEGNGYEGSQHWAGQAPVQQPVVQQPYYRQQPNSNGPFKKTSVNRKRGSFKYIKEDTYEGSNTWARQAAQRRGQYYTANPPVAPPRAFNNNGQYYTAANFPNAQQPSFPGSSGSTNQHHHVAPRDMVHNPSDEERWGSEGWSSEASLQYHQGVQGGVGLARVDEEEVDGSEDWTSVGECIAHQVPGVESVVHEAVAEGNQETIAENHGQKEEFSMSQPAQVPDNRVQEGGFTVPAVPAKDKGKDKEIDENRDQETAAEVKGKGKDIAGEYVQEKSTKAKGKEKEVVGKADEETSAAPQAITEVAGDHSQNNESTAVGPALSSKPNAKAAATEGPTDAAASSGTDNGADAKQDPDNGSSDAGPAAVDNAESTPGPVLGAWDLPLNKKKKKKKDRK